MRSRATLRSFKVTTDEYDQPYQPTAQDWAEVRHQAACDAFRQSEKYYKKVDAAAKLARRLHDAKCKRILANQMRAPVEKRWRYVDKLQELCGMCKCVHGTESTRGHSMPAASENS